LTDLPLPSTTAAPAARSAAAGAAARAPAARPGAAQAGAAAFQDALAQELGLVPDGLALPVTEAPVAAAKADTGLKSGDERKRATAAADAALGLASVDASAAATALLPAAVPVMAAAPAQAPAPVEPSALASASSAPTGLPAAARAAPAAAAATAAQRALQGAAPPPAAQHFPPGTERAAASAARQDLPTAPAAASRGEAQPKAEAQLPATPTAADAGVAGKILPAAGAEPRREFTLAPGLLEQNKTAPAAAPAMPIHSAPAPMVQPALAAVNTPVAGSGWDKALGDQLVWMADQKHQVAELHLNPPELGPLKITLTLDHDHASAQFVSAHAVVRDAIEHAMPRLREMLAGSGITLGNADVSADTFRGQAQQEPQRQAGPHSGPGTPVEPDAGAVTRGTRSLRLAQGLVDTFA
jgi:flagellar hook-length control protein FliK